MKIDFDVIRKAIAAVDSGDAGSLRLIGQAGLDLAFGDSYLFRKAVENGNAEVVRFLVETTQIPHETMVKAFFKCASLGWTEVIKVLHCNGVSLASDDYKALHNAIEHGAVDVIRYLHENGVDITRVSESGLYGGVAHGQIDTIKYLHESGVELHKSGQGLLNCAVLHGQLAVARYLVKAAGVSVMKISESSVVAAAVRGHLQLIRWVHHEGYDISAISNQIGEAALSNGFPAIRDYVQNSGDLVFPSAIIIDNHRACNATCRMCPTQQEKFQDGAMKDEVFNVLAAQIEDFKDSIEFVLFGVHGEPLLDKKLEERIARLSRSGFEDLRVNTNGSAMTPVRAGRLLEAGVRSITISVDGFTKDTYEKTRIGLKYETVTRNIESLICQRNELDLNVSIVLRMIVQSTNFHEVNEWHEHWKKKLDLKRDGFHFVRVHNWAYDTERECGYGATPCQSVFETVVVSHDGSIPLCCLDYKPEFIFGNVKDHHVLDIFNNSDWKNVRALHAAGNRERMKMCDSCSMPEGEQADITSIDEIMKVETSFSWKS